MGQDLSATDTAVSLAVLVSFNPETPKQCCSAMGWGFHGVSRTAVWQGGDSKKIA